MRGEQHPARVGAERPTANRRPASRSPVLGWPRLLDVHQAAAYLNVSFWTLREFLNAGSIPIVRLPRPRTSRVMKRRPVGDTVRRLLIDRADLDRLVWEVRFLRVYFSTRASRSAAP